MRAPAAVFLVAMHSMTAVFAQSPSVQQLLDEAARSGSRTVTLPDGRIRVDGHLLLQSVNGLTIEGAGTTLVFSDHAGNSWTINSSSNIVLRGFTVDYDPLPFVQGRITARSQDGRIYEFAVSEGYPGLTEADRNWYQQAYIFEPDRHRWKPWVPDLYATSVEIIDTRHGRFFMGYTPARQELIRAGDRIVLTLRSGVGIRMNDCENVRIEDVTFLAAPGCAYVGCYMRGDNYYRYTIKPGPPPPGATEPRLISTCADGFNYANATKGPTIEGCRFSFMGDDAVNLHGATFVVLDRLSPTELLVGWPFGPEWLASVVPKGSAIRRLRPGNYEVLGSATLSGFVALPHQTAEQMAAIHRVRPELQEGRGTVFRLTLTEALPAEPGEFIDIPANNAPGFVIRDCVFEDHRARGTRIGASNGIIEGNVFRRIKMNAVSVGPEYGYWREAGWLSNLVVRNNVIEDVGRDAENTRPYAYALGAIAVICRIDPESRLSIWPGNQFVEIRDNLIRDCPVAGIYVAAARNVTVSGNRLENVLYSFSKSAGNNMGLDLREPIDTRHAEQVTVVKNILTDVGVAPQDQR